MMMVMTLRNDTALSCLLDHRRELFLVLVELQAISASLTMQLISCTVFLRLLSRVAMLKMRVKIGSGRCGHSILRVAQG